VERLERAGSDTINGASTSITINVAYGAVTLVSDGSSKWTTVGYDWPYAAAAHNYLTGWSSTSGFTAAQPSFSDLTGIIASSQVSGSYTGITGVGTLTTGTWNATTIGVAYGGTGDTTLTAHAVLLGEGTSAVAFATTGTAGQVLIDQGSGSDPAFKAISGSGATITLSAAGVITISAIANSSLSNSSVTVTAGTGLSGGGPVSLGGSVTMSLTSPVVVGNGGTGSTLFTAYSVICGGTTSTGPLQNVSGVGTSGQVLTSNDAGALPTWQNTFAFTRQSLSNANYTVTGTGSVVVGQTGTMSASRQVTLPRATKAGQLVIVVDESGTVSATNTVTFATQGGDTIDGGTLPTITGAYGIAVFVADGTSKWTVVWTFQGSAAVGGQTANNQATHYTGTTTNTLATVLNYTNNSGVHGSVVIKNTGGSNSLDCTLSTTDMYGTVQTASATTLTPGASVWYPFDSVSIGTTWPPYKQAKVQVVSTNADQSTTYDIWLSVVG
jgi:hypothetical protein